MGTILSIATISVPIETMPITTAEQAYLKSQKNIELNNKLHQEIKNTSPFNGDRFNILYEQTYEGCKTRVMIAMLLGKTQTKCLDIGRNNERTLMKSGYNLTEIPSHPYYHVRVSWNPNIDN